MSNFEMPADCRIFLGLQQPPLISAAQWLSQRYTHQNRLNMEDILLVLPTSRAGERISQLLVETADHHDVEYIPPLVTTVGKLPEFLYLAEKDLATDLAQQLAWSKAIEQSPDQEIKRITGRSNVSDLQDWQPLATLISRLHTRLANDIWSFRSVVRAIKKDPDFLPVEIDRWEALNSMQQRYYRILSDVGLWDRQAARNFAASGLLKNEEIRCSTDRQMVVIGAADLNRSVSEMLRQIAVVNTDQVNILVAAEPSMADRFNEFGCLITERWLESTVPLDDDQILIVDQPADQADAAAYHLSQLSSDTATDQITIGVPDPNLVPQLSRAMNAIDVPYRSLIGRSLNQTAPVRLMLAVQAYLDSKTFDSFAALVRHPDLFQYLVKKVGNDDWLHWLDQYQNQYLPNIIDPTGKSSFGNPARLAADYSTGDTAEKSRARRQSASIECLNNVQSHVADLLQPLIGPAQPIADWTDPWGRLLVSIYGNQTLDPKVFADRQVIQACESIYQALGNQRQIPDAFEATTTASQALTWAVQAAAEVRVVSPAMPNAIEFAGWLDLALDDAPVMVVTSLNDEHVPSSEVGDQFLPNELCRQLGILDNDRRYARDLYALTVIAAVRSELLLIVGRRSETGDPKKPSRLLFADSADVAARRAKAFFQYGGQQTSELWLTDQHEFPATQQFEIPQPNCSQPLTELSVTKFKSYIECPYRFYLKNYLKLDTIHDDWRELNGGAFGDLCHQVLEDFGQSDDRDLTDSRRILQWCNDRLDMLIAKRFSGSRMPAVRIQIEQLRMRFERLAPMQARRRQDGWRIVSTEELLEHELMVDGQPFTIRGKIDRVDQHETTGQVAVWDYKSSDQGTTAQRAHYRSRKKTWVDLQLPLYRHLVKEVAVVAGSDFSQVTTGYVLLPKKLEDVGFDPADWTPDQLHAADDLARDIIRKIRRNEYWPPVVKPPKFSEIYAAICQDNAFEPFDIREPEQVAPW